MLVEAIMKSHICVSDDIHAVEREFRQKHRKEKTAMAAAAQPSQGSRNVCEWGVEDDEWLEKEAEEDSKNIFFAQRERERGAKRLKWEHIKTFPTKPIRQ